ncbi:MAG: hypothetical protein LBQ27_06715 [Clostridiales bacterium]|jgi:lysophospholipase L1-like esterase|nr:hypothetical protein [Clostridiales bacterium]
MTSGELLSAIKDVDQNEIRAAAYVIVYIGANDILSLVSNEMNALTDGNNPSISEFNEAAARLNSVAFKADAQNAVDMFKENYAEIINYIKTLNNNIMAATIYNPYDGIIIENPYLGLNRLNLGLLTEEWIEKLNAVIASYSELKIADVFSAFASYKGEAPLVNAYVDILDMDYEFDPHPTIDGQKLIAEVFQAKYSEAPPKNEQKSYLWLIILSSCLGGAAIIGGTVLFVLRKRKR